MKNQILNEISYFSNILFQRYRKDDDESNSDDDYVPYVPVRERKKQELLKLGRLAQVINFILDTCKSIGYTWYFNYNFFSSKKNQGKK